VAGDAAAAARRDEPRSSESRPGDAAADRRHRDWSHPDAASTAATARPTVAAAIP